MTQIVRLCISYSKNALCRFEYTPHGTGRLVLNSDYTFTGPGQSLDTGVKLMLVSSNTEVTGPGYYYTAVPYLNPALKIRVTDTPVPVYTDDPLTNIIAYPTGGQQGKEMYNLKEGKDKPTLSLRLLSGQGMAGTFERGAALCFLTFPVGFDLLNKETCFELT